MEAQYCFLVVLLRLAVPLCGFGLILYFRMKNILSDTILQMVDHTSDSPEPGVYAFGFVVCSSKPSGFP